ncbi:MotA/TolQ/ExbB proton channel family protein [Solimicrobium silvestre]|uniref:Biopolymer transport protein n=1 Tax=Solimicrobium silvestre TaxID=2099400 RepID=A0A2S9H1G0_9BURK|nr:MotA/TolQ/ExbB proton channel family protein [Solimicrobium silvestre]PRC93825.1 Biopolymer transport protein [Solimicrobium silvestre]
MNISYLVELANESGGILYLMLVLLLVALTVIIERTRHLGSMEKGGAKLINMVKKEANHAEQIDLPKKLSHLPHARLFNVLRHDASTSSTPSVPLSGEALIGHLEEAIMHEVPALDRSLWVLDTVITLAPLLGLFGTIIGMFNAFHVLGDAQNGAAQVTGGIAEALVSTACGLLIAMIGLVFFNALHNRVRIVLHQLETLKIMLVNRHPNTVAAATPPVSAQVELIRTPARA